MPLRHRCNIFWGVLSILAVVWPAASFSATQPLTIFVSVLPQQYIVQQIGQTLVSVQTMVPPGASPHTYEPKPAQMAALARAQLYFSVGVQFENAWLPKFAALNPRMKVVASDAGITKIPISAHADEGKAHFGDERLLDPHIWLSPPLIKVMARNICTALVAEQPAQEMFLKRNLEAFDARMDGLDQRIKALLAGRAGTHFIVFHPSWGYFARTYDLVQIPIETEGKEPKPAQLQHLIIEAKQLGIRVIFVQPQFSVRSARLIAETVGARVVPADPLPLDLEESLLHQAQAFQTEGK